jgi:c-di-GMP-binding flagellar brake protein YcgR
MAPLQIGDKIQLRHTASAFGRTLSENIYSSQILDYDEKNTLKVSMPISEGRIIPLEVGDDYQICFFTESGLFRCEGRIQNRYTEENMYVMDIFMISALKKYQRRQFYRLDCIVDFQLRIVSETEQRLRKRLEEKKNMSEEDEEKIQKLLEKMPKEWKDAIISDLSGGGIRFCSRTELPRNSVVEAIVPLTFENGVVNTKLIVKILSCDYHENMRTTFEIRGEFVGLTDTVRELIVQYVFEQQRRRMRKE